MRAPTKVPLVTGPLADAPSLAYLPGAQEEFINQLSPFKNPIQRHASDYDAEHHSLFQVEGRHVFNLWRMLKGELTLNHYSFENVAFHLLHRRCVRETSFSRPAVSSVSDLALETYPASRSSR